MAPEMTPEERFMAVLKGEKPDVMPWFTDLTWWYRSQVYRGALPRGKLLQIHKDLGVGDIFNFLYEDPGDPYEAEHFFACYSLTYKTTKVTTFQEKMSDGTVIYETKYHTPLGTLTGVLKFVPGSVSTTYVKYPVEKPEDLKILQYIYKDRVVKPNYEPLYARIEEWKGWAVPTTFPGRSPFQRLIVEFAGVTNTYSLLLRAREELEETLQIMEEEDDAIYDIVLDSPAVVVLICGNLSSDIISPPIFKKYYAPIYKKRSNQLHSKGKYAWVHIDGTLRGLLPLLSEAGVDIAESLTPAPIGDVPIEKFRELAGPNIILMGGLPGVYFSPQYPQEKLVEMVMKVIECHLKEAKFIISGADQVPPDGDINRVKLVTQLVEEYGRY